MGVCEDRWVGIGTRCLHITYPHMITGDDMQKLGRNDIYKLGQQEQLKKRGGFGGN